MALKAYKFVGLSKEVLIPDDILVEISIIDNSHTRSYQVFSGQTKSTWHDTGTYGSNADSQRNWLRTKPSSNVSGFNFAADGQVRTVNGKTYRGKIIQLTPLNEITWAAGTAVGNKTSFHVEQCFGGNINWSNSLYVNASLHGALIYAKGLTVSGALVQHNYWYGKNCPGQIRAKGIWSQVVGMVQSAYNNAKAADNGQVVPPDGGAIDYVTPSPIMVDGVKWDGSKDVVVNGVEIYADKREVTTASVVNLRQYASATSSLTGDAVAANQKVNVLGWVRGEKVGEEDRWWITATSQSRMWVGGTTEKPEDSNAPVVEPKPEQSEHFRIVNGVVFYKASNEIREVTVANDANVYKYADTTSAVIGSVKADDKIKVAYWCLGEKKGDESVWWVLDDPQGRDDIEFGGRVHVAETMDRPD